MRLRFPQKPYYLSRFITPLSHSDLFWRQAWQALCIVSIQMVGTPWKGAPRRLMGKRRGCLWRGSVSAKPTTCPDRQISCHYRQQQSTSGYPHPHEGLFLRGSPVYLPASMSGYLPSDPGLRSDTRNDHFSLPGMTMKVRSAGRFSMGLEV